MLSINAIWRIFHKLLTIHAAHCYRKRNYKSAYRARSACVFFCSFLSISRIRKHRLMHIYTRYICITWICYSYTTLFSASIKRANMIRIFAYGSLIRNFSTKNELWTHRLYIWIDMTTPIKRSQFNCFFIKISVLNEDRTSEKFLPLQNSSPSSQIYSSLRIPNVRKSSCSTYYIGQILQH